MVSRYFKKKNPKRSALRLTFRRPQKNYFFRFRPKVVKLWTTCENLSLPAVNFREKQWRKGIPLSQNYAYFIDFVPFFLQNMSNHRLKCLAKGLIVTKTSFHAGFWYLSRIKRSTRLPNHGPLLLIKSVPFGQQTQRCS